MPAHDLPYFESAGGQNAGASSVVKAFGLARSRETAWPAAYRRGRAPLAGRHAPPGRRLGASLPGPASLASGASGRSSGSPPLAARTWVWRPSPALSPPWPGRTVAPGTGSPLRGTGRDPVAIWRGWPVRAWASQAPSKV